ncbi:uncharacterized protein [Rutidosis leptorrhynchoides]|uniref:uncharacterized protein n=1 Tax=Rutidosis leptorrhynchoides TaxID=125765 RepID=UPI003A99ABCB
MQSTSRAEAERLLGIAEKLLHSKDLNGCRDFALLAQETEPLLDGSDQILAVVDVLIASDKRINNKLNWYAIFQIDPNTHRNDDDLIKRQYRRLALLLHPDKNKFPFADTAFKLISDAWAVLSDSNRKSAYDNANFAFTKVDLVREKIPVRRNISDTVAMNQNRTIWTTCPFCYNLYEYPCKFEGCCLRCMKCKRAYEAVAIPEESLPPFITGKEAYYCCWGYFPMGFAMEDSDKAKTLSIPNWMPPMFPTDVKAWPSVDSLPDGSSVSLAKPGDMGFGYAPPQPVTKPKKPVVQPSVQPNVQQKQTTTNISFATPTAGATVPKKRGRPRKNPF